MPVNRLKVFLSEMSRIKASEMMEFTTAVSVAWGGDQKIWRSIKKIASGGKKTGRKFIAPNMMASLSSIGVDSGMQVITVNPDEFNRRVEESKNQPIEEPGRAILRIPRNG